MSILSKIKNKLRRKILGYRADSDSYIAHLRSVGVSIGGGQLYLDRGQSS